MSSTVVFPYIIRPIAPTADNGSFYAKKEGYIASWEEMERAFTCLCQRTSENKWSGRLNRRDTTWNLVGLSQTSAV
jgi:hypothetical protein